MCCLVANIIGWVVLGGWLFGSVGYLAWEWRKIAMKRRKERGA